jgi:hypothetical protein
MIYMYVKPSEAVDLLLTACQRDPFQMQNYLATESTDLAEKYELAGRSFKHLITRLDALLMVLKSCRSRTCRKPWESLHPRGKVATLSEALDPKFDAFYNEQPKVSFSSCVMGHIVSEEGPQNVDMWPDSLAAVFAGGVEQQPLQDRGHWSWWT